MKKIPSPLLAATVAVLALFIPLVNHNAYHIDVLVGAGLVMLLALGLNVIVGYTGILHLGFAAVYAVGAYTYAILNTVCGVSFWPGLLASGLVAALFSLGLCLPALRLSGDYIAIVTLGAGEIVRIVLNNVDEWTGGPNGILGIDHPRWLDYDFGVESRPYYYLLLGLIVICVFFLKRLENSRIGRAWIAIREDELAAQSVGVPLAQTKALAFAIAGFIGGMAGCVFAAKQGTVSPDSFDFILSVMLLAAVVLGGIGNIPGVLTGSLILSILPECLRGFDVYRMLIFGLALIAMMFLRPQGLWPESHHREEFKKNRNARS